MKRSIHRLLLSTLGASLLSAGCSSQEAPPTAREEAESARDRAKDQAELAHKYALWSTPQLEAERDRLAAKIGHQGNVVAPVAVIAIVAAARNNDKNRWEEVSKELQRRQGAGRPTVVAATSSAARTGRKATSNDPYEKWMRENLQH